MIGLIPKMTSNTAPSGTATASSSSGSNLSRAYNAFDGNFSSYGDVYYGSAFPKNVYTRYIFPNTVDINGIQFAFNYQNGSSGSWIDITLQVSYDGTTWENYKTERLTWTNTRTAYTFNNLNLTNVKGIGLGASNSQSGYGAYFTEIQAYPPVENNIVLNNNPLTFTVSDDVKLIANFERVSSIRIKVNGQWKYGMPFIKVNNAWKQGVAYTKINGSWKEGL